MFVKALSIILLSLSTFNAAALNESTVVDEIQNYVLNGKACLHQKDKNFWSTLVVQTQIHTSYWHKEDYNVYVSKFGCELGKNGSVVIAPGRTESSVEYYETAIDLTEKGFSPVYVVDHVGQGFSPRLLPDGKKGHIVRFDDYVNAFDSAVNTIELDLNKNEGRTNKTLQPLFFLSNSMGGAIGIGYFQNKGNKNPFKAAALLGPMIRINYLGFPQGDEEKPNGITHPTLKETLLYSEHGVITQAHYFCTIKGCDTYSTKAAQEKAEIHGTAYIEGKKDFDAAFEKAPEQVMTHSKERYNLKTFLWEDLRTKKLYSEMGFNNPQMAEPTYQWVKQAAKFNKNMRKKKNIELMSTMPIRIITGEKDVRSYTPSSDGSTDLSAHIEFCDTVNSVKSAKTCQFTEIKGAYHELLKESELYREPALEMVVDHFLAN